MKVEPTVNRATLVNHIEEDGVEEQYENDELLVGIRFEFFFFHSSKF